MKSYSEFMEYIKENVTDYLPERFEEAEISIQQVVKNNDVVLDGLSIRNPDSNLSPNIYLNPLYEQYQKGRNLDELVSGIADTYIENMEPIENRTFQVQIEDIKNYEVVKEEIFPRLVNLEKNTTRLQNVPYMQREDLAITYHVKVSGNRDSIGSLMITNELMEVYGVTKEKLHTQAMENMERLSPPVFLPLGEMIVDVMTEDFGRNEGVSQEEAKEYVKDMIPTGGPNVYCLTNQYKMNEKELNITRVWCDLLVSSIFSEVISYGLMLRLVANELVDEFEISDLLKNKYHIKKDYEWYSEDLIGCDLDDPTDIQFEDILELCTQRVEKVIGARI